MRASRRDRLAGIADVRVYARVISRRCVLEIRGCRGLTRYLGGRLPVVLRNSRFHAEYTQHLFRHVLQLRFFDGPKGERRQRKNFE
jgi:hypothetical protein